MADLQREEDLGRVRLDRTMVARLAGLLGVHRRGLFGLLGLEIAIVASIVVRPWFLELAIDEFVTPGIAGHGYRVELLAWLAAGLFGAWFARFGIYALSALLASKIAIVVLADLRKRVYAHAHELSMRFFDLTREGRIVSRVDRDIDALQPLLIEGLPSLLGVFTRSFAGAAMLWFISPPIFYASVGLLPLMALTMWMFKSIGTRLWARVSERKSRVTAHLVETISGVRAIQQATREAENRRVYDRLLTDLDRSLVGSAWGWGWFMPFMVLIFIAGMAIVLYFGGRELAHGQITVGEMTACMFYLFMFLGPLQELGDIFERGATAAAAAQRIFLLLDTRSEVVDPEEPVPLPEPLRGHLRIEDLHFAYDREEVIRGIDLEIPAGSTLAIVGATGHGKSTLVQLLARFYQPSRGRITIDGVPIDAVRQDDLRRRIGIVLQDNVLFSGTVAENLRLARPEAEDPELARACAELGVGEALDRLPDGLVTQVGPGGERLSHGQRQMVCLVRAWLADPAVLILDEATSAVDAWTENLIREALQRLCAERTAVVVAHRLSTIRDADRIIVMHEGRIVEEGRHQELIRYGGEYARLYERYRRRTRDRWGPPLGGDR